MQRVSCDMAFISVIVPIYKVDHFLPKCIDSILMQTFGDFELILVDDGSPDSCGQICDRYAQKDDRITVIHKKNAGVSAARNTALEIASGQYITFCDSDDYYRPDWLEKLVTAAQKSGADLTMGNYIKVSETDEILGNPKQEAGFFSIQHPQDKVKYCIDKVFGSKHGWEVWTKLFRAEIIREKGIRFCESCGNFAEDLGFVLEYLLYTDCVLCLEDSGYCYRIRSGSMMCTSKDIARLDSVNEVALQFLTTAKQVLPSELHDTLPIFFFLIMYNQYCRITGTDRYPYLKEELKKIRRYDQWKRNTRAVLRCKKQMKSYLGKNSTSRILILNRYCLHGSWKRFQLMSALFYRTHVID